MVCTVRIIAAERKSPARGDHRRNLPLPNVVAGIFSSARGCAEKKQGRQAQYTAGDLAQPGY
jgi:hypothetical protein